MKAFPIYSLKMVFTGNSMFEYQWGECLMTFPEVYLTTFHNNGEERLGSLVRVEKHRIKRIQYWIGFAPLGRSGIPEKESPIAISLHTHDFDEPAMMMWNKQRGVLYPHKLMALLCTVPLTDIDFDYGFTGRQAAQIEVTQYDD